MTTNKILSILFALLLLVGCDYNDKYFEGYDDVTPTDVKKIEYTLSDADYKAIATNKTNEAIAKEKGHEKELAALTNNKYFTDLIAADVYAPAFIATKWFTADDESAVKLTYNNGVELPEYVQTLNAAKMYTLSNSDYSVAWGEEQLNFFTPNQPASKYLPTILSESLEGVNGDVACVVYNYSEKEPADVTIAFKEDFDTGLTANTNLENETWSNVTVKGKYKWQVKSFSGNFYVQQSGYKHSDGDLDSYLISKEITVESGMQLAIDAMYVNYVEAGGRMQVLVSTNLTEMTPEGIEAANWDDLSSNFDITYSLTNTGDAAPCGIANLSSYAGKKLRIAFRYVGDGTSATTTIRLDNIAISTPGKNTYSIESVLYAYNGANWIAYSNNNVRLMTLADFVAMGQRYDNFSSTLNADDYLPIFLQQTFPYAQEKTVKTVAYKYFASNVTTLRADEYILLNDVWTKNNAVEVATDQFVKSGGKWKFDPSILITLTPMRSSPMAGYFQAIVDYVMSIHGTDYNQLGSSGPYTNAEFYYGASSYQSNISFRISDWRTGNKAGKDGAYDAYKEDTKLTDLMYKRLEEAFIPALKKYHGDMAPIEGIDVLCTIQFGIYTGNSISSCTHQIVYKVIGKGEFEYVKDSLVELK